MNQMKSWLLIVCFYCLDVKAQFKIVGLLNVEPQQNVNHNNNSIIYQTNAQGRGFSVNENVKQTSATRPKNIIRVRIIEDLTNRSDFLPNADNIFMVETNKNENKRQTNNNRRQVPLKSDKTSKLGTKIDIKTKSVNFRIKCEFLL